MPIQEIMKLRFYTDEKKLSLLLAIHCAPILFGIKASNIVMVTKQECLLIEDLLQGTAISHCFMKTKTDTGILYLYREQEMIHYLCSEDVQLFLEGYGYETKSLQMMLDHLSKRIELYNNDATSFPHEIGVFLEYPLMDVKGFLEHNGANYICSGYWKVYADVQDTLQKFKEYDLVRELAIWSVVSGKKIREIAV